MKYRIDLLIKHLFSVLAFVLSFVLSLGVFDFNTNLYYYEYACLYTICAIFLLISIYTGINLSHNKN